ncbi:MAG: 3-deoxy-D-manno-octulosonic acid transferase [Sulfuriferula sp.]|nr:3-deoxy-D-manno-octulosonic acid transferase [Sulfuriferula sp.]
MIARLLYNLLIWLLLPYTLMHLLWRGRKQRGYLQHIGERFGFYQQTTAHPVIWLHAVSVGETRAAKPLIEALLGAYPQHQIVLTHITPTGRDTSEQLFGNRVVRVYLPYDFPFAVRRFLRHFQPRLGLLMETEIWPNLIALCHQQHIPTLLINARLSARSARRYAKLGALIPATLAQLSHIAAQTADDAARLRQLGGQNVSIMGNLKFDSAPPAELLALGQQWREQIGARWVWVAASTRAGEEALIIDAWQALPNKPLLAIIPRHPQRFDEVAALLQQRGVRYQRRSTGEAIHADTQIWLGDSMGELYAYYTLADVAFIGGSLMPLGGQNLIEAASVGCPVVIGASMYNFAEVAQQAITSGAAVQVQDVTSLTQAVTELLADAPRRQQMHTAALTYSASHQGATVRLMALINQCYPQ